MKMDAECRNKILYIHLQGEMDEHGAAALRREADKLIDYHSVNAEKAVFDLQGISFMDSTGIGFLIGRYKTFQKRGIPVYIANPSQSTDNILAMSGVYSLIPKI